MQFIMKEKQNIASSKVMKKIKSWIFIFFVMGFIYTNLELMFRNRTHVSMLIVGGLCGALIGLINEKNHDMKMWIQCIMGTLVILAIEFISGYIVNIKLGLNVWDYSGLKFNIMGQISLLFAGIWFFLSVPIIWLDDYLRYKFFDGEYYGTLKEYYRKLIILK